MRVTLDASDLAQLLDFILATMIAGEAECLVTGDAGLLALRHRYPILTPAEFAERL